MLAVPVAPADTVTQLGTEVDDLMCLSQPEFFKLSAHTTAISIRLRTTQSSHYSMRQHAESFRFRKAVPRCDL